MDSGINTMAVYVVFILRRFVREIIRRRVNETILPRQTTTLLRFV